MFLYRFAKAQYANDVSGTGGLYGPGRWHREGTQILYLAEHVSLAKLEVLANSIKLPQNMSLVTVEVPDDAPVRHIQIQDLPNGWETIPYLPALADITEQWIQEERYWIMRVPSAQSSTEYNYLLIPLHPEHKHLKIISIEPHPFDNRLK